MSDNETQQNDGADTGAETQQNNEAQAVDTPDQTGDAPGAKVADSEAELQATKQDFLASLPDNFRELAEKQSWNNLTDVHAHLTSLENRLDGAIVKPSDGASADELAAYYQKLGRPEKPSDYKIALSGDFEDDLPWDDDVAEQFRLKGHELGLTTNQFNDLMSWYVGKSNEAYKASKKQYEEDNARHAKGLVELWGDPKSDGFQNKVLDAAYGLKKFGGEKVTAELKALGVIDPDGKIRTPHIADHFAKLGKGRTEDQTIAGGNLNNNPFANMNASGSAERAQAIINQDPDKARRMIKSAGGDPSAWLL